MITCDHCYRLGYKKCHCKPKLTHGGKRPGSGPKADGFIRCAEKLAFVSDAERARYLAMSTRERVELALWAADILAGRAT